MEKKDCINYTYVLTDNEILTYALLIDKFEEKEIDYKTLKNMFLEYNVNLDVVTKDYSASQLPLEEINRRQQEENYTSGDITSYILNSEEYKNVDFKIDYTAMEILANANVEKYQTILIDILKFQLMNSHDTNEILAAERRKWKKRINELESQLKEEQTFSIKY